MAIKIFMIGFAECDLITNEDDIPPFTSINDVLNRCLNLYDDINLNIYKTDGTCIEKRKNIKKRFSIVKIELKTSFFEIL